MLNVYDSLVPVPGWPHAATSLNDLAVGLFRPLWGGQFCPQPALEFGNFSGADDRFLSSAWASKARLASGSMTDAGSAFPGAMGTRMMSKIVDYH
jgi:hypothetical protein